MGTPWMTEPKVGDAVTDDWRRYDWCRQTYDLLPAPHRIGRVIESDLEARDWRRPDLEFEHPDPGEIITKDWWLLDFKGDLFLGAADECVDPSMLGSPTKSPKDWVRPIRRKVQSTTTVSSALRIFLDSAHDPAVGLRGTWPSYDD